MYLIQVSASFYAPDAEAPQRLLTALGQNGHVEYGADTGIARARLEWTKDGDLLGEAQAVIDFLGRAAEEAGMVAGMEGEPFEIDVHIEELVAIGGNLHRRGVVVTQP